MKKLLICSINQNLHDSLSSFLDSNFSIHCCFPSANPADTVKELKPDICFFDREVIVDSDITMLSDIKDMKSDIHVVLAYFYYEAGKLPENEISTMANDVILKPYQFEKLIDKINSLAV
ncbi:MAG: hypothetical protein KAI81_09295 [Candidatus Marinimicrobia bacterium]|nr:hypothetical protein [Candidatus Neomarinimicrobiota bacterium]